MDELGINSFLSTLKQTFVEIMRKFDLDKSDLVKTSKFEYKDGEIIISMNDYAIYVNQGRRAGSKQPPQRAILRWILRNPTINIPQGMTAEQLSFVIARSIGIKGIKAKPFLEQLNEDVVELTTKYIFNKVNLELQDKFNTKQ